MAGCPVVLGLLAASALAEGSFPLVGSPARGARLIAQKGCGACHTIPGIEGADGLVGPPFTQWSRRIFVAGLLRNTQQNVATWVLAPQRFVPGNAMPSTGLPRRKRSMSRPISRPFGLPDARDRRTSERGRGELSGGP